MFVLATVEDQMSAAATGHDALSAAEALDWGRDDAARVEGRRAVDAAIVAMARAAGAQIQARPIAPGYATAMPCAEPAAGIRLALMLRDCADAKVRQYIRRARQDGLTWQQIGQALGLALVAEDRGVSLAEAAFGYAADAGPWERGSFAWMCPACREVVVDRGPSGGHPEDCEGGHADRCGRLAAAVAAYEADRAHQT